MADVVLLQIIQSVFWLLVLGGAIFVFRKEIKMLLRSIGSFEVAGASFHLKDQKETLKSYALLSDILIDLLSREGRIEPMRHLMVPSQIETIGAFALKYTTEVERQEWNEELLKNIAYLLFRFGRYKHAVQIYDALLEKRPDHVELLNLKALALMTSRLAEPVEQATNLLRALTKRYPEFSHLRFNYALALSLSENVEEAYKEMRRAITDGYSPAQGENPLLDPLFHHAREARPDLIEALRDHLTSIVKAAQQRAPAGAKSRAYER